MSARQRVVEGGRPGSWSSQSLFDEAVCGEDIVELCQLGMERVKAMLRPDTTRIGEAFDVMMAGVQRRGAKRHASLATAVTRCFEVFAGRGHTSVTARQFARRLSVLSMEWSGNFTQEEYLALAHVLSDEESPGLITLESFVSIVKTGSSTTSYPPDFYSDSVGSGGSGEGKRGKAGPQRGGRLDQTMGAEGAEYLDDTRAAAATGMTVGDTWSPSESPVVLALARASHEARGAGEDVWKLLDDAVLECLELASDDPSATSDDVASAPLTPEALRLFLTKLNIRIAPPLPMPPNQGYGPREGAYSGGTVAERQQNVVDSDVSVGVAVVGDPAAVGASSMPSSSPLSSSSLSPPKLPSSPPGLNRIIGGERKSPQQSLPPPPPPRPPTPRPVWGKTNLSDAYLRAVSRETASVRSRVRHYNEELARATGEAECLISQATGALHGVGMLVSKPFNCDRARDSTSRSTGIPSHEADPNATSLPCALPMLAAGGSGDDQIPAYACTVAEVASRGSIKGATFVRVSPVERPTRSHPRVDVATKRVSTACAEEAPKPVAASGATTDAPGESRPPYGKSGSVDAGSAKEDTAAGCTRLCDTSAGQRSEKAAAVLAAALAERTTRISQPQQSSSARTRVQRVNNGLAGSGQSAAGCAAAAISPAGNPSSSCRSPTTACRFDPPSVHNGLTGLRTEDVDKLLLKVEASTRGSRSCWRSPERAKRGTAPSTTSHAATASVGGYGGSPCQKQRCQGNTQNSSWTKSRGYSASDRAIWGARDVMPRWEKMRRVIRAPPTLRAPSTSEKNLWDTEQMRWVGSRERDKGSRRVDRSRRTFSFARSSSSPQARTHYSTAKGSTRGENSTDDDRRSRGHGPPYPGLIGSFRAASKLGSRRWSSGEAR